MARVIPVASTSGLILGISSPFSFNVNIFSFSHKFRFQSTAVIAGFPDCLRAGEGPFFASNPGGGA
jgi:hypothetical protein